MIRLVCTACGSVSEPYSDDASYDGLPILDWFDTRRDSHCTSCYVQPLRQDMTAIDGAIQEQFEAFHAANPWIYERLVADARALASRGHARLGIGMLWEVLRYQLMMATDDPSGFKLNNNYRSRYVRLIVSREADLADVFELRRLRAA